LQNSINAAQNGLDNALDVNLTMVASLGTYMREVDSAVETAGDTSMQLSTSLSELQDLDYAEAISKLSFQQVSLDAAQKSFVRIQELSLFSML
jgi:flagellar hook-associated protein 3 FlgL